MAAAAAAAPAATAIAFTSRRIRYIVLAEIATESLAVSRLPFYGMRLRTTAQMRGARSEREEAYKSVRRRARARATKQMRRDTKPNTRLHRMPEMRGGRSGGDESHKPVRRGPAARPTKQ